MSPYVPLRSLPEPAQEVQGAGLPWAGYWYPKRGKDLFEASDAPMRKLDAWLKTQGKNSWITPWEEENYDMNVFHWGGLRMPGPGLRFPRSNLGWT